MLTTATSLRTQRALSLNGQPFIAGKVNSPFPVLVKPSEAEKNYAHNNPDLGSTMASASAGFVPAVLSGANAPVLGQGLNRVYVGNLHPDLTEVRASV